MSLTHKLHSHLITISEFLFSVITSETPHTRSKTPHRSLCTPPSCTYYSLPSHFSSPSSLPRDPPPPVHLFLAPWPSRLVSSDAPPLPLPQPAAACQSTFALYPCRSTKNPPELTLGANAPTQCTYRRLSCASSRPARLRSKPQLRNSQRLSVLHVRDGHLCL